MIRSLLIFIGVSLSTQKVSDLKRENSRNVIERTLDDVTFLEKTVLLVENGTVKAVDNSEFNITVELQRPTNWSSEHLLVSWECTGRFVTPATGAEKNLLFTSDNNSNTFSLQSSLYGVYFIRFYSLNSEGEHIYFAEEPEIELHIQREDVSGNDKVVIMVTACLSIALILMGLELDLRVVVETFKRPVGPGIGMVCQFLLMPCLAYLLGWLFLETRYERLGLLLLGTSPGGANSNFWTAMFDGDVNLSCTMTFLSSLGSFLFTTMWVYLLGSPLVGKTVTIPYLQLTLSLASFTVPLLIGVGIKFKWPKAADKIRRISKPFFLILLIIFPVVGLWQNKHFFYLCTWRQLVAGSLLGFLGYTLGAGLALICRQERAQIVAISLETAIQNGGIAFVVLNLTFESPISDMANMPIIAFFFCSTGPCMFVFYGVYLLAKKIMKRKGFESVSQNDTSVEPK